MDFARYVLKCLGFENLQIELSLMDPAKPDSYIGELEVWERSEAILRRVLQSKSLDFTEVQGEAAFYGPKIDFQLIDVYGHKQQGSTIQLDFNLPERFDLDYVTSTGTKEHVALIHRAILGSLERFIAAFIENCGGAFPMWVSPVQVAVLPITDDQRAFARAVCDKLSDSGLRALLDDRSEKLGLKIREHAKTPYLLVIGKKEVEASNVSVRRRSHGQMGTMTLDDFVSLACEQVRNRIVF